jgi:two-component system cell cycle sensor histidine kinase/response regulator CckA
MNGDEACAGRVLLVEDNGAIRRVLTAILLEGGFEVEPAADGEQAAAMYEARPEAFVALVTDIIMPGLGGPQLVRRLRAINPALPVLYLSGYARERAGVDEDATRGALLAKPFHAADLVARVAELVGRPA